MSLATCVASAAAMFNFCSFALYLAVRRTTPGWRSIPLLAFLAFTAGLYGCVDMVFNVDGLPAPAYREAARLSYLIANLHCLGWVFYAFSDLGEVRWRPSRGVVALAAASLGSAAFFALTGAHLRAEIAEVSVTGDRYHFPVTTLAGDTYGISIVLLLVVAGCGLLRRARRAGETPGWQLAAFGVFIACAIEEALSVNRSIPFLGLGNVGVFAVMLPLAGRTVRRTIGEIRWLGESRGCTRSAFLEFADITDARRPGNTLEKSEERAAFTARREADDALAESEERFRSLFEAAGGALALIRDGVFVQTNQRMREALGRDKPEAFQARPADFSPEFQADGSASRERAAELMRLAEAGIPQQYRWDYVRPDGSRLPGEAGIIRLSLRGGTLLLHRFCDLTERSRLEDDLGQARRLEALGLLAGGVAHDLNNLLSVIYGYSDMLLSELPVSNPARGPILEVHKAGARAALLIRHLLAVGRRQAIEPRAVDLNLAVADSEAMLRRLAGPGIVLETRLEASPGCVLADPIHIQQILLNLVVNARDAMPNGGLLTIRTGNGEPPAGDNRCDGVAPEPGVWLAISDTGYGMTEEVRRHIFEPFYTTKCNGTGLGLATVRGIVQQSKGRILVESEPGRGSLFRLFLPGARQGACALPDTNAGTAGGGKGTVLIVEDDTTLQQLLVKLLGTHGYRVLQAGDGCEAMAAAESYPGPIHALLTGEALPRLDGRSLAESLIAKRPEMRVLYMSGASGDNCVAHTGYIAKPFAPRSLIAALQALLRSE
jgi:PAS domain S-box-containing protein